jgi:hypothetical protein
MGVKDDFFDRESFVIGDGKNTCFLEDVLRGDTPLSSDYHLFIILPDIKMFSRRCPVLCVFDYRTFHMWLTFSHMRINIFKM